MTLEILVGPIASGKSTYARSRADSGALVIAHDDLTAMLHARCRYEQGLRETYRRMEELLATEAIISGRDVIIDRTNLTRESRARWIAFRRNAMLPPDSWRTLWIIAVAFPILDPSTHARRRFESDPRGRSHEDWYAVAQHHYAQALAEPLSADEGFGEIREVCS